MHTGPDGYQITARQADELLMQGTHIWAYMECGPLTVTTRWWGEPERPWLTRAWIGDTLIGKTWSLDKRSALAAFHDWCRLAFEVPAQPLRQHSGSSSTAAAPQPPTETHRNRTKQVA